MRIAALALVLAATAAPVFAADVQPAVSSPLVRQGEMLRDVNNVRLSTIDSVNRDGSVGIIFNGHYVTLPATSLSAADGKLVTTLTKAQINAMN